MCLGGRTLCRAFLFIVAIVIIITLLPENAVSKVVRKGVWSISTLLFRAEPRDHYERLGVRRQATTKEIKKAYRAKCLKYHPDKTSGNWAKEQYLKVQQAHEILADSESRMLYDRELEVKELKWRQQQRQQPPHHSPGQPSAWQLVSVLVLLLCAAPVVEYGCNCMRDQVSSCCEQIRLRTRGCPEEDEAAMAERQRRWKDEQRKARLRQQQSYTLETKSVQQARRRRRYQTL